MFWKKLFCMFIVGMVLASCRQNTTPIPSTNTPVPIGNVITPTTTRTLPPLTPPTASPTSDPILPPTATPTFPPALPAPEGIQNRPATTEEINTAHQFRQNLPPARHDIQLAIAYKGVENIPPTPASPLPYEVGTQETFFILNIDNNTVGQITAELKAIGDHAYFWFDLGAGTLDPNQADLDEAAQRFDQIYNQAVVLFGNESNPGIDGDPRVHVVNVSPLAVCDVTVSTAGSCGLAGYFSAHDTLPAIVDPTSNEREMFVMNVSNFGGTYYFSVLAHEFRHMIEDNYDSGDRDWEVEGSAVLAETLLGYGQQATFRADRFLAQPDQQLTNWGDGGTTPHYGQGYLFNRYLYDRLGEANYKFFATSPLQGFPAIDAIAQRLGDDSLRGEQLWADWLVALALHQERNVPAIYDLHDQTLNTATMTPLNIPYDQASTVEQYAADYYTLNGFGTVTLDFQGNSVASVMGVMPASGNHMWVANRHNYSNPRLTRALDLTNVSEATLTYDVYHDIELGYDFAYVSVSTDGGHTWQGLVSDHMQGLAFEDDPSDAALTDRFYTGHSDGWQQESIDLTPFAGQPIYLRFEYITDPILTFSGIALDNIQISAAHLYDDAETEIEGWVAEGFVRSTAWMPQSWVVQLITFPVGEAPQVTLLPATNGTIQTTIDLSTSTKPPILIVAASAPMTLMPANYRLSIR